jgi:hypothetical protein
MADACGISLLCLDSKAEESILSMADACGISLLCLDSKAEESILDRLLGLHFQNLAAKLKKRARVHQSMI